MSHWAVAPILLPLLAGAVLMAGARRSLAWKRTVSICACLLNLSVALRLLGTAAGGGGRVAYAVGGWSPPFGIVLVVDRLAALMTVLVALVALAALIYAGAGQDARGRGFHGLFQFQVLGLNGTFLTGDLFNLFVFFEILLIASYGLLLQEAHPERSRAGFHYVVLNLAGSSLFLVAAGLLYGVVGTLNLADLAVKMPVVPAEDAGLVRSAALLLLMVFGLKGALAPLHFWLPPAYASAPAPAAALFSLLTKAGAYGVLRIFPLVFGSGAGSAANVAVAWVWPAALATVLVGAAGLVASKDLGRLISYLVILSMGTLFTAVGLFQLEGVAASLYYLIHSTVVTAGLFLLADLVARQRDLGSLLAPGSRVAQTSLLGTLFLVGGMAVVGMPPLSGFVGKVWILEAAWADPHRVWVWIILLFSGLVGIVALSRAGSLIFWKAAPAAEPRPAAGPLLWMPVAGLLGLSPLLALAGGPVGDYCRRTAIELLSPAAYVSGVLEAGAAGGFR